MRPVHRFLNAVLHLTLFAVQLLIMAVAQIPGAAPVMRFLGGALGRPTATPLGAAAMMLLWAGLVSRGAGLLREVLIASRFGAGAELDAVLLGLATPMAVTVALGSALARAAVPVGAGLDAAAIARLAWWGTWRILAWMAPVSAVLLLAGVYGASWWGGPAADGARVALIAWSAALGALALVGGGLAGLLVGLANARGHHGPGAWNPVIYNVIVVASVLALSNRLGPLSLAAGILIAEWTQVLWYGRAVWVRDPRAPSSVADPAATERHGRAVVTALGPALAIALVTNANVVVDRAFASELVQGSVAALGFAERLLNLPVGLMGMALTVPFVTRLGQFKRAGNRAGMSAALRLGVRALAVAGTAGGFFLAAFAQPLVALLFERGAFDAADTALCAQALVGYATGTPLLAMTMFLTGAVMIDEKPWRLVGVLVATVGLNAGLDAVLGPLMGVMGIALATTIVSLVRVVAMMAMMDPACWRDGAVRASLFQAGRVALGLAPMLAIMPALSMGMGPGAAAIAIAALAAWWLATPALVTEARTWWDQLVELDRPAPPSPAEASP